ncbi:MAG TPA: endonuclease III [Candidatus Bathyarchaeia archaeon]|nr:endonuclease III [Candidatus Bathyarchaeia archaeon]
MTDQRANEILRILKHTYGMPTWAEPAVDPFRTLIVTIISQNTNVRNTEKAFERLSNHFRIDPETLAHAQTKEIENSLKTAGLYRNKAKAIKQVSKVVVEKYRGNLKSVLSKPLEDARQELMQLPNVGPKTADVVLLFAGDRPTVPVDTHVNRISKRLGFAPASSDYEMVRRALQSLYHQRDYLAIHVLLISHGRKCCKARSPHCGTCPLNDLCPSRNLLKRAS